MDVIWVRFLHRSFLYTNYFEACHCFSAICLLFCEKPWQHFFFCVSCFYKLAVFFKRPNVLVSESIKKKEYNKNIFSIAFTTLKLKPAETKDTAKNGIQQELAERM